MDHSIIVLITIVPNIMRLQGSARMATSEYKALFTFFFFTHKNTSQIVYVYITQTLVFTDVKIVTSFFAFNSLL